MSYGDSIDNTVEGNSSVFSLIRMHWLPSARQFCSYVGSYVGSKTVHQQNPPVLNWRWQLTQVTCIVAVKQVVVVVVVMITKQFSHTSCLLDDVNVNSIISAFLGSNHYLHDRNKDHVLIIQYMK